MKKCNLVVVGYGGMGGGFHVRHALESDVVRLLGIYDILPERRAAAREKGLVRSEGKEYVMQDGDVVLFRFNV